MQTISCPTFAPVAASLLGLSLPSPLTALEVGSLVDLAVVVLALLVVLVLDGRGVDLDTVDVFLFQLKIAKLPRPFKHYIKPK